MRLEEVSASVATLLEMSPEEFEGLIAKWLSALGWHTRTTSRGADGGVDVIAYNPDPLTGGLYVAQCKRYAPETIVGAPAVRDFFGTLVHHGAVRGLFVTTSGFSKEAQEFAQGKPIALIDGPGLLELLEQAGLLVEGAEEGRYVPHAGQDDLLEWANEVSESDPAEAERICAELLREDPAIAEAWSLLGHVRYMGGRTEDALEAWRRALDLDSDRETRYYVLLSIGLALHTGDRGRVDEAHRYFEQAQSECPYHIPPVAQYWVFTLCLDGRPVVDVDAAARACLLGDFLDKLSPREERCFDEVTGLPNSALVRVRAAGAQAFKEGKRALKAERWDEARKLLADACECIPNERGVWLALGHAYARGGYYREAIDVYNVFLAAWPEAEQAGEVETCVVKLREHLQAEG